MNLNALFKKQRQLDDYIIDKKGLEGQDLVPNRLLALQVELGELANEWRGFKHWSDDQDPRREKMLEEYVDCLHFILSIGNDIEVFTRTDWGMYLELSVTDQFLAMFEAVSELSYSYRSDNQTKVQSDYIIVVYDFLGLGHSLKFSWEQIEQAYNKKWEINKKRQDEGY